MKLPAQKTSKAETDQAQKVAVDFFTASQLAAALGVTRTRAHQLMSGADTLRLVREVRGVQAHCWPVGAIPPRVAADLHEIVKRKAYCNIAHLLACPPVPWQPIQPLGKLSTEAVTKAQTRCEVLAPILAAQDAQTVRVSELVRRATAGFARLSQGSDAAGERAIRRWIEEAIDRDRGLWQWDRVEIYLDDKPDLKSDATRLSATFNEAGGEALASALLAVQKADGPSDAERREIFNAAFHRIGFLIESGSTAGKAKKALLRILIASGVSLFGASEAARLKQWQRYYEKWSKNGCTADALEDGRAFNDGRPVIAQPSAAETTAIKRLALKTGSQVMALNIFADSAVCSSELREAIHRPRKSRHNLPLSLRRAASVTPEMEAHERGGREYQYTSFTSRRSSFEVMEDGGLREIEPGDWWELDDMSWNQPFWFESLDGDDALAQKHGASMARQCLLCADVKSGKWLGAEFIGRARDAYRAEDILRFFRRLFAEYGLPRRGVRLERGTWKSRVINGQVIQGLSKEDADAVFGGLRKFGIRVEYCWTAKQKGHIESAFGYLQKAAAAIVEGPNVGRWRGERARDSKQVQRARDGIVHPRAIGCLHVDQIGERARQAMIWCNSQAKEGRIQSGVPDEGWFRSVSRAALRPLPPDLLYLLLPEQRELKVRAGHVWPTVAGISFQFSAPGLFADLGTGYRVIACFDPTEPTMGAWIFNAETGTANRDGHTHGAFLGHAEHCAEAPQFAAHGFVDENIERRRKHYRAFRVKYVSTGVFGHNAASASELRDGRGNVARIERGGAATPVPSAPAGGKRRRSANGEGDSLVEKAKAMQAAKTPKPVGPSLEELALKNRIGHLEMIDAGEVAPYFLGPDDKVQLETLRTAYRARLRLRGSVDVDDLKQREEHEQEGLGIYKQ